MCLITITLMKIYRSLSSLFCSLSERTNVQDLYNRQLYGPFLDYNSRPIDVITRRNMDLLTARNTRYIHHTKRGDFAIHSEWAAHHTTSQTEWLVISGCTISTWQTIKSSHSSSSSSVQHSATQLLISYVSQLIAM